MIKKPEYKKAFVGCGGSHTEFKYDCHGCLVKSFGALIKILDEEDKQYLRKRKDPRASGRHGPG